MYSQRNQLLPWCHINQPPLKDILIHICIFVGQIAELDPVGRNGGGRGAGARGVNHGGGGGQGARLLHYKEKETLFSGKGKIQMDGWMDGWMNG